MCHFYLKSKQCGVLNRTCIANESDRGSFED